jgi:hypothetical protein
MGLENTVCLALRPPADSAEGASSVDHEHALPPITMRVPLREPLSEPRSPRIFGTVVDDLNLVTRHKAARQCLCDTGAVIIMHFDD